MAQEEYVVINKTMLEDLIKEYDIKVDERLFFAKTNDDLIILVSAQTALADFKRILNNSTLLIPIVSDAIEHGKSLGINNYSPTHASIDVVQYNKDKTEYINKLKINI